MAIAGLGLLGASLALALRNSGQNIRVLGCARREETVAQALTAGVVEEASTDPQEILPQADLTVICMPIEASIDFAVANQALWRPGAVVTDVGSIKTDIVGAIRPVLLGRGIQFVGSHPMAGSEKSGLAHADSEMYRGAVVFVTPHDQDPPEAIALVRNFWESLHSRVVQLDTETHDALVARTSHLIHLIAGAAVNVTLDHPNANLGTASGFRDFSRIAAGSAGMWREIICHNRDHVLEALDEITAELGNIRQLLDHKDWDRLEQHLQEAGQKRRNWYRNWLHERGQTP